MCFPVAFWMAVVQERTASPFRCTVQQPHRAIPQPYFVPCRPRTSRTTHSRGVPSGTSTVAGLPFTVSLYAMESPPKHEDWVDGENGSTVPRAVSIDLGR